MQLTEEQKKVLALLPDLGEIIPKPEGKEDWLYRSINWCSPEHMEELFNIIGQENIHMITGTAMSKDGKEWRRASFWLSPTGLDNVIAEKDRRKEAQG